MGTEKPKADLLPATPGMVHSGYADFGDFLAAAFPLHFDRGICYAHL